MLLHRLAFAGLFAALAPFAVLAQSTQEDPSRLSVELNALNDVDGACRLTFLARNTMGVGIDKAVFETVIFDTTGGVVKLSLFDFRDLPFDRPRVRQFDLPGLQCENIGQALINGANSCVVDGSESEMCREALSVSSRVDVELIG